VRRKSASAVQLKDDRKLMKKMPQHNAYDELILGMLLFWLRLDGGTLTLDRYRRLLMARDGLSATDLKRAVNIAGKRQLITVDSSDGVPLIKCVESEREK
jgi:hypothetical protein